MRHRFRLSTRALALTCLLAALSGCRLTGPAPLPSPASSGLNTRDLIDTVAQAEAEDLAPGDQLAAAGERLRKDRQQKLSDQSKKEGGPSATQPDRNILCLSGGGSLGAYSAGVMVGWTRRGDRPVFDVVTGISTGALIAPSAFLGPKYDSRLEEFYTTTKSKHLFTVRRFWGLFHESYADTAPLAARIDAFLSPEVMRGLAEAHRGGRRLYIGTTESEGKRFVVWDVGAMAERDGPGDRELIGKVLLASSAIPGLFPAVRIDVTVDGVPHVERHVDGGVSQAVFYRPPYVRPEDRSNVAARDLAGAKVYVVVAGKLYADPEVIGPWSFEQVGSNVSTLIYAQTRGDLQRMYTSCLVNGMDYFVSAIPPEFPVTTSSAVFEPGAMAALFAEGRRVVSSEKPWRTLPPGVGPGETGLTRVGSKLTYNARGPLLPISGLKGVRIPPRPPGPLSAVQPEPIVK